MPTPVSAEAAEGASTEWAPQTPLSAAPPEQSVSTPAAVTVACQPAMGFNRRLVCLDPDGIRRGMGMAEVFGPPRCKRPFRHYLAK